MAAPGGCTSTGAMNIQFAALGAVGWALTIGIRVKR